MARSYHNRRKRPSLQSRRCPRFAYPPSNRWSKTLTHRYERRVTARREVAAQCE